MRRLRRVLVLLVVVLAAAGALWLHHRAGPAVTYQIVDLGVISGATNSQGFAINAAGEVTGFLHYPGLAGPYYTHAFLWRDGRMTDLGALPGLPRSSGVALNAQGTVVGGAMGTSRKRLLKGSHASRTPGSGFVYEGGRMKALPALPGNPISGASAINDRGQVVGSGYSVSGGGTRAFLFQRGAVRDLGTLGPLDGLTDQVGSYANGINGSGQIVGTSEASGGEKNVKHAFLYSQGTMTDLGTLSGYQSSGGVAINDQGQVAGSSSKTDGDDSDLIRRQAFLWQRGTMRSLGTLPGYQDSYATGLNSRGQVVGMASTPIPFLSFLNAHPSSGSPPPDDPPRPFLYENGRMTDLNALLPAHSGWVLEEAHGINDKGQIVGTGRHDGKTRAFVLTPMPVK